MKMGNTLSPWRYDAATRPSENMTVSAIGPPIAVRLDSYRAKTGSRRMPAFDLKIGHLTSGVVQCPTCGARE